MSERIFRYHPKDKPIPEGWQITGRMQFSHHGEWSILIEQVRS